MNVSVAVKVLLLALKSGDESVIERAKRALAQARKQEEIRKLCDQVKHLALD